MKRRNTTADMFWLCDGCGLTQPVQPGTVPDYRLGRIYLCLVCSGKLTITTRREALRR